MSAAIEEVFTYLQCWRAFHEGCPRDRENTGKKNSTHGRGKRLKLTDWRSTEEKIGKKNSARGSMEKKIKTNWLEEKDAYN
jgi:hypothetical protein